ncbi:hypothetical protein QAD02_014335 [Eretmocerus hayati]|uniref:Uncharacterized protein n=1 Tax=Eretmocerus hayati TaxID=131215 RepID=A0ACC2P4Z7_9HYME|nr:hypothetical protein QAD02_014335 [Eretmocerus hayati]
MASRAGIGVDDVDLIDLEAASSCVARMNVADATPEEQEHLLDVCPPKLEQKLSLTRPRRGHEHLRSLSDGDAVNSVLVTLGHDQLVPVRRRIDVVSSDTIKRVRDITRNLEPVISVHVDSGRRNNEYRHCEDRVDSGGRPGTELPDEDTSFEAQQINDAFNFLSEHDEFGERRTDDEGDEILHNPKRARLSETSPSRDASRSRPSNGNSKQRDSRWNSYTFDNEAFEHSPTAECPESDKRPISMNLDIESSGMKRNSLKHLRSLTCSTVGFDAEPFSRAAKNCSYRKSWSGGSSPRKLVHLENDRIRTQTARLGDQRNSAEEEERSRNAHDYLNR